MIIKAKTYYQKIVETHIRENMSVLGPKTLLRDACEYALMNGGKRLRPSIVLMVAEALGQKRDVLQLALAVEYFHTASLVADDLPCMDDDDERRSKPSVHKVYGEAVALLISYALLAAGYDCLAKGAKGIPQGDAICVMALENVAFNAGLQGAPTGQYLDINPPDLTLTTLREAIHKKTVTLFEIAFVTGWLYGGGDPELLPLVKKAASHYGMAFQIADDIGDVDQDALNERKVNVAGVFGVHVAESIMREEAQQFRQVLKELEIDSPALLSIAEDF